MKVKRFIKLCKENGIDKNNLITEIKLSKGNKELTHLILCTNQKGEVGFFDTVSNKFREIKKEG